MSDRTCVMVCVSVVTLVLFRVVWSWQGSTGLLLASLEVKILTIWHLITCAKDTGAIFITCVQKTSMRLAPEKHPLGDSVPGRISEPLLRLTSRSSSCLPSWDLASLILTLSEGRRGVSPWGRAAFLGYLVHRVRSPLSFVTFLSSSLSFPPSPLFDKQEW